MKQKLQLIFIAISILAISVNAQEKKGDSEMQDIMPELTHISKINAFFKVNDVAFYSDIPNDPIKAINYKRDHKIAANMGVYLGDMIYVFGTKGYKVGSESYGAAMELAKKMGIEEQFPDVIIDRYRAEKISADDVVKSLDDALDKSEKKLSATDKKEFYDFMIFGNYIEKLYIVSTLIQKSKESDLPEAAVANLNRSLLLLMARQHNPLETLSKLMSGYSSNVVAHRDIRELLESYKKLETNKDEIVKMKPAEMFVAKDIVDIQNKISKIRERIVK